MLKRLFDTSILITQWSDCCRAVPLQNWSTTHARTCARKLIELWQTDLIVTPVAIELLCGTRNQHEAQLAQAFLGEFRIADAGHVTVDDWKNARRLAARVPRDGRKRQLGDCLIRAIADRCRLEIITDDKNMERGSTARRFRNQ